MVELVYKFDESLSPVFEKVSRPLKYIQTFWGSHSYTVKSLLTDTPNKGHCIKYLSTMDKTKSPNFSPPINIMQLESLNSGQSLYSGQTT